MRHVGFNIQREPLMTLTAMLALWLLPNCCCWAQYFNDTINYQQLNQTANTVIVDAQHRYLSGGGNFSYSPLYANHFIAVVDSSGNVVERNRFGSDMESMEINNLFSSGPFYYSEGTYRLSGTITNRIAVAKLDASMDTIWRRFYGADTASTNAGAGIRTADGGFAFTGWTFVYPHASKVMLLKIDSLGNQQFFKTYTSTPVSPMYPHKGISVLQMPDKGYLIVGLRDDVTNNFDQIAFRTDSDGNQLWTHTYTHMILDALADAVPLGGDTALVFGYVTEAGVNIPVKISPFVACIDGQGTVLWQRTYMDSVANSVITRAIKTDDGNVVFIGNVKPDNNTYSRAFVMKITPQGDSLWCHTFRRTDTTFTNWDDYLMDIKQTDDHGFVLSGDVADTATGGNVWLLKLDCVGCDTPGCPGYLDCIDISTGANPYWKLQNNVTAYPNPFNDRLTFKYSLSNSDEAKLCVYDLYGRRVFAKMLNAQFGNVDVNLKAFSNGLYSYRLVQKGNTIGVGKIVKAGY